MNSQHELPDHPFAAVKAKKDFWWYLFWTASWAVAPVLFPLRIMVSFVSMSGLVLALRLATRNLDLSRPIHPVRRWLIQVLCKAGCRGLLLGFGYWRFATVNEHLKPDLATAYVGVSNHVSSLDPVLFILAGFQSFVSKSEVRRMFCFGDACAAMQGLFLERGTSGSGQQMQNQIQQRVHGDIHSLGLQRLFPALFIFPEGSTVNQKALLPFKQGAFQGKPVSVCFLKYSTRFRDPSDASQNAVKVQLSGMLALFNSVTMSYFGDYVPNESEMRDPLEFARNVRAFMAERSGAKTCELQLRDKLYFNGKSEICSEEYKARFGDARGSAWKTTSD